MSINRRDMDMGRARGRALAQKWADEGGSFHRREAMESSVPVMYIQALGAWFNPGRQRVELRSMHSEGAFRGDEGLVRI